MLVEKGYALITGASQGLGRAIALQIAERGYGIIAVARTRVKLEETAAACRALNGGRAVSYTHLRAHETVLDLVCRLLLEKKKNNTNADLSTYEIHRH